MNCVNISAQNYTTANSESDLCEITIFMWNTLGFGWSNNTGIEITVDDVNYGGTIKLPQAFNTYEGEKIVFIPSGEVIFTWIGIFQYSCDGFEIYNTLGELIYTSPNDKPIEGVFFTYQNECPNFVECLPIKDFEGIYISEEYQVNLSWIAPESDYLKGFDIYRNDILLERISSSTVFYSDNTAELENGYYKYCVVPAYPVECDLDEECFGTYLDIKDYENNILIYPNPANNIVNILGVDVANVKVSNNVGQLLLSQHNTNTINVSELQNGIYILSIETLTGYITQKKIIINH
jgi:hypothetical protein